jgi:hypothetical protein
MIIEITSEIIGKWIGLVAFISIPWIAISKSNLKYYKSVCLFYLTLVPFVVINNALGSPIFNVVGGVGMVFSMIFLIISGLRSKK